MYIHGFGEAFGRNGIIAAPRVPPDPARVPTWTPSSSHTLSVVSRISIRGKSSVDSAVYARRSVAIAVPALNNVVNPGRVRMLLPLYARMFTPSAYFPGGNASGVSFTRTPPNANRNPSFGRVNSLGTGVPCRRGDRMHVPLTRRKTQQHRRELGHLVELRRIDRRLLDEPLEQLQRRGEVRATHLECRKVLRVVEHRVVVVPAHLHERARRRGDRRVLYHDRGCGVRPAVSRRRYCQQIQPGVVRRHGRTLRERLPGRLIQIRRLYGINLHGHVADAHGKQRGGVLEQFQSHAIPPLAVLRAEGILGVRLAGQEISERAPFDHVSPVVWHQERRWRDRRERPAGFNRQQFVAASRPRRAIRLEGDRWISGL